MQFNFLVSISRLPATPDCKFKVPIPDIPADKKASLIEISKKGPFLNAAEFFALLSNAWGGVQDADWLSGFEVFMSENQAKIFQCSPIDFDVV